MKAILFKTVLLVTISIFTISLFGQTPDSLGMDDNGILNRQESTLLDSLVKTNQETFNFTGKRIAFVTGSSGGKVITKSNFFKNYVRPWIDKDLSPHCFVVPLTEQEKRKSGGYDAIALSWVKLFTIKQKRRIIIQLQAEGRRG